jgi:hypothetical protein
MGPYHCLRRAGISHKVLGKDQCSGLEHNGTGKVTGKFAMHWELWIRILIRMHSYKLISDKCFAMK